MINLYIIGLTRPRFESSDLPKQETDVQLSTACLINCSVKNVLLIYIYRKDIYIYIYISLLYIYEKEILDSSL